MSVCCNCVFCNLIGLQNFSSEYKTQYTVRARVWLRQTNVVKGLVTRLLTHLSGRGSKLLLGEPAYLILIFDSLSVPLTTVGRTEVIKLLQQTWSILFFRPYRGYVPKIWSLWDFCFYMGIIYEHNFNRYPRGWSTYFYTLPMVINQLHLCLLNLLFKSLKVKRIATLSS